MTDKFGSRLAARLFPEEVAASRDPVEWVRERLGEHLWSKQVEVARAVLEHRHVAVPSAHGTGKSFLAARLGAWWIATRPTGDAFLVTTAPTTSQVRGILWRELGRAHRKGGLPGRITTGQVPEWTIASEIVAWGRKPADLTDPEAAAAAFQGVHARHVLVVIDEAAGIEPWLWDAVDSLVTSERGRVLALGNPTDPTSRFADVCEPGSGWHVVRVPASTTPAFTGEKVPGDLLDVLVSRRWVDERRKRWGIDSPLYVARVNAEFPEQASDALIAPSDVEAARTRILESNGPPTFACDVARSGTDETVVYEDRGGVVRLRHRAQGQDTMVTTGRLAALLRAEREGSAVVDVIGIGAGVYDRLREQGLPAMAFNSSERAGRPDRFANRRAEAYWSLREALQAGRLDLDPADDELAAQLCAIKWTVNSRGQIVIESKADMRKRGVPSPDRADALAMAVGGRTGGPRLPTVFVQGSYEDPLRPLGEPAGQRFEDDTLTGDLLERGW
jgi:hypothetical protein